MKILHILEATQGGTRRHLLDLLPALQRRGIDCDLLYSCDRNPDFAADAAWLQQAGVGTYQCPMTRDWGGTRDADALRFVWRHLRTHRYDLIHCHSTKAGLVGRIANVLNGGGLLLVYTPHCIAFDTGLPHRQRRLARTLEALLAPFTTRYVAVSRREQRTIVGAGLCRPSHVAYIPNGIDLDAFDAVAGPNDRGKHSGAIDGAFTVGCFGRLSRQKNQELLLRALPALQRRLPTARLLLVGGGDDEASLRALTARLGLETEVCFSGEIAEARPLYRSCDLAAQPSRWEGCPYSVLEAMAAGRPIIATPVGGVPELLGHGAGVQSSATNFAQQLEELAADPDQRRQLGRAAREKIENQCSLDTMLQRTVKVYDEVHNEHR